MTQITKKDKSFRIVVFLVPKLSLKPKLRIALTVIYFACVANTKNDKRNVSRNDLSSSFCEVGSQMQSNAQS